MGGGSDFPLSPTKIGIFKFLFLKSENYTVWIPCVILFLLDFFVTALLNKVSRIVEKSLTRASYNDIFAAVAGLDPDRMIFLLRISIMRCECTSFSLSVTFFPCYESFLAL